MKAKKQPEELDQWEAWDQPTYRTGGTQPPKSYGGLVALLLVLVIFLCGISTALGLMNIQLFRQLNAQLEKNQAPVVFSQVTVTETDPQTTLPGIEGMAVPDFWQNYHDLPKGLYVTDVYSGSTAWNLGIRPGDIIMTCNTIEVTDLQTLQQILEAQSVGSTVSLCIYRNGEHTDISVTIE